jgi:hypothetical protein
MRKARACINACVIFISTVPSLGVHEKQIFGCHIGYVGRTLGEVFGYKKQITEPVRKLRDESNDTN